MQPGIKIPEFKAPTLNINFGAMNVPSKDGVFNFGDYDKKMP
jgi:hypothetical protein